MGRNIGGGLLQAVKAIMARDVAKGERAAPLTFVKSLRYAINNE
jgi:hypothetical protein